MTYQDLNDETHARVFEYVVHRPIRFNLADLELLEAIYDNFSVELIERRVLASNGLCVRR